MMYCTNASVSVGLVMRNSDAASCTAAQEGIAQTEDAGRYVDCFTYSIECKQSTILVYSKLLWHIWLL